MFLFDWFSSKASEFPIIVDPAYILGHDHPCQIAGCQVRLLYKIIQEKIADEPRLFKNHVYTLKDGRKFKLTHDLKRFKIKKRGTKKPQYKNEKYRYGYVALNKSDSTDNTKVTEITTIVPLIETQTVKKGNVSRVLKETITNRSQSRVVTESAIQKSLPHFGVKDHEFEQLNLLGKWFKEYSILRKAKGTNWVTFMERQADKISLDEFIDMAYGAINEIILFHDSKFLHYDIKHQNFMVDPDTLEIFLIDTDLSDYEGRILRRGTVGYFPPEVAGIYKNEFVRYTEASDTYSFGLAIKYLLLDVAQRTQVSNFTVNMRNVLEGIQTFQGVIKEAHVGSSDKLDNEIDKLVETNPSDRTSLSTLRNILIENKQSDAYLESLIQSTKIKIDHCDQSKIVSILSHAYVRLLPQQYQAFYERINATIFNPSINDVVKDTNALLYHSFSHLALKKLENTADYDNSLKQKYRVRDVTTNLQNVKIELIQRLENAAAAWENKMPTDAVNKKVPVEVEKDFIRTFGFKALSSCNNKSSVIRKINKLQAKYRELKRLNDDSPSSNITLLFQSIKDETNLDKINVTLERITNLVVAKQYASAKLDKFVVYDKTFYYFKTSHGAARARFYRRMISKAETNYERLFFLRALLNEHNGNDLKQTIFGNDLAKAKIKLGIHLKIEMLEARGTDAFHSHKFKAMKLLDNYIRKIPESDSFFDRVLNRTSYKKQSIAINFQSFLSQAKTMKEIDQVLFVMTERRSAFSTKESIDKNLVAKIQDYLTQKHGPDWHSKIGKSFHNDTNMNLITNNMNELADNYYCNADLQTILQNPNYSYSNTN